MARCAEATEPGRGGKRRGNRTGVGIMEEAQALKRVWDWLGSNQLGAGSGATPNVNPTGKDELCYQHNKNKLFVKYFFINKKTPCQRHDANDSLIRPTDADKHYRRCYR